MRYLLTLALLVGCAWAQDVPKFSINAPSDNPNFYEPHTLVDYVYMIALAAKNDIPLCAFSNGTKKPCLQVNIEPMDVPAIQEDRPTGFGHSVPCETSGDVRLKGVTCAKFDTVKVDACADKRRVLLTSEDGVKHCILFPKQ